MSLHKAIFTLFCFPIALYGQSGNTSHTEQDSTRWGKWSLTAPAEVQPLQELQKARNLKSPGTPGWRVRVFRANSKNARQKSLELVENLKIDFPAIPVYWSYESPFFKVSLGDFRTKEEAIRFLQMNREQLPTAFVVSEAIFPAVKPEIPPLPEEVTTVTAGQP